MSSAYSVKSDICTCDVCHDSRATECVAKRHDCCEHKDSDYVASYVNDQMLD